MEGLRKALLDRVSAILCCEDGDDAAAELLHFNQRFKNNILIDRNGESGESLMPPGRYPAPIPFTSGIDTA